MEQLLAIIGGTGQLGSALALRWAAAGRRVCIGSRDHDRAQTAADRIRQRLGRDVEIGIGDYAGAVAEATVVVLTVPFPAQLATMKQIRGHLPKDCVLVDTTVPLAVTLGGSPCRTFAPWQGSAAQQAADLAPPAVRVVAALHTIAAGALDRWPEPVDSDVLVTGDDVEAKSQVARLIELIPRLRTIDAGPLEMARVTEQTTALLIGINRRYKARGVGIRITGLPQ